MLPRQTTTLHRAAHFLLNPVIMGDETAFSQFTSTKLGKYEVRKLIGKGSMGMVFLGYDPVLERDVAIKIMAGTSVYDRQMRERFEREAKAVGRLHHPNIVTVHDLGYAHEGLPFIAMELLEGNDLDELLETHPPLSRKLEILIQACRGLQHAHENGVIHRDIKPANIFVTNDGTAKIMDFGVARWTQTTQTQSGLVVGTAGYMAPEQIRGQRIDARCDVFSLGVVLYEALTGRQLFPGDSLEAIFFATLTTKPPVLTLPDGSELPGLQKILARALSRDVEKRFESAEELAGALETFVRHHAPQLPEGTIFQSREPAAGAADASQRPTIQTPAVHTPAPTAVVRPKPTMAAPRRGTGSIGRASRSRRTPIAVAFGMAVASAAGIYLLLMRPSESSRSHAAATTTTPALPQPASVPDEPAVAVPSPADASATLVADAALALGSGNLQEAEALIALGVSETPDDPRWEALREQLRARKAEAAWKSRALVFVRQGRRLLDAGEHQKAIDAFREAMQHDPRNADARSGLDEAIEAQRRIEARPEPRRRFVESRTEFVPGPAESSEVMGFETEEGIDIKETADPLFPAQLVIELDPADARPGQPYVLRVKLFNEGYRPIDLRELQLVSRFGNQTTGKGQPISLRAPNVAPQTTAVLHEISGTWKEAQNRAEIEATVVLTDGAKLIKRLSW